MFWSRGDLILCQVDLPDLRLTGSVHCLHVRKYCSSTRQHHGAGVRRLCVCVCVYLLCVWGGRGGWGFPQDAAASLHSPKTDTHVGLIGVSELLWGAKVCLCFFIPAVRWPSWPGSSLPFPQHWGEVARLGLHHIQLHSQHECFVCQSSLFSKGFHLFSFLCFCFLFYFLTSIKMCTQHHCSAWAYLPCAVGASVQLLQFQYSFFFFFCQS